MSKIEHFDILFEKLEPVYYSGEPLSGKVMLKLNERMKVNSIKCSINGTSDIHWEELYTDNHGRTSIHRKANTQRHICVEMQMWEGKKAKEDSYLNVGEYVFPFKFNIPSHMPASFEYKFENANGRTRYSIESKLDVPW